MLDIDGERFEYEMYMLLDAPKNNIKIEEETIETIYEDNNSGSHFNPIKDSYRIYKQIFRFIVSSISSFVVDYILYTILNLITGNLVLSNIVVRVFSSLYNYIMNRNIVFKDKNNIAKTMIKYYLLAVFILTVNTLLLLGLTIFGVSYALNTDRDPLSDQKIDGISFESAKVEYKDGISTFTVIIYNEDASNSNVKSIGINIKDKDNKDIKLVSDVDNGLEAGEGRLLTATVDKDITNIKSLEYVINK